MKKVEMTVAWRAALRVASMADLRADLMVAKMAA